MLSRLCRICFPKRFGPDPQRRGLLVDGQLVTWSEVRSVGYLTYIYHASVDVDYVVVQTVHGTHFWFEVSGWSVGSWTQETVRELEAWWVNALAGLADPPESFPFGGIA